MNEQPEAAPDISEIYQPDPHVNDMPAARPPVNFKVWVRIIVLMSVLSAGLVIGLVWAVGDDVADAIKEDIQSDRSSSPSGNCNEVELFVYQFIGESPADMSPGRTNNGGKALGSAYGCMPVCLLEDMDGDGKVGRNDYVSRIIGLTGLTQQPFDSGTRWLMADATSVFSDDRGTGDFRRMRDPIDPSEFLDGIVGIRLTSLGECRAYDAQGNDVLMWPWGTPLWETS